MKKILVLMIIILVAFGVILTGCDEDETTKLTTKSPKTEKNSGDGSGDSLGSAEASVDEGSESSSEEMNRYLSNKATSKYTVVYNFKTESGARDETMEMKYYYSGPDNFLRMDGNFGNSQGSIFIKGTDYYSCSKNGVQWTCMKLVSNQAMAVDPTEQFKMMEENLNEMKILKKGSKIFAGTKTECFGMTISGGPDTATMEQCYTKEGIPLYLYVETEDGTHTMEAKEFSLSVSPADFELPAEPVDMDAMMAQYQ